MSRLLTFALIHFFGAISPGPDFAIITRFGMTGSRRAAFSATIGVVLALLIHVSYCFLGITALIEKSPRLFTAIQMIGALYLGYLACKILWGNGKTQDTQCKSTKALAAGFLCNLLNPKATLFILSMFVQFVYPTDPLGLKVAFALVVPCIALLWFGSLSYFLTHPTYYAYIQRYQKRVTQVIGCALFALSTYILLISLQKLLFPVVVI